MTKPTKLTNEQMRPGQEVEEQQRGERLKEACEIFSKAVDCEVQEGSITMSALAKIVNLIQTNTLNHILESGLLEEKEYTQFISNEHITNEEVDGHNTLARDIKEFISNMDSV